MDSCTIDIDGIKIFLKKSKKLKRLNIKINPDSGVCVNIPKGLSFKAAKEFTRNHKSWIFKNYEKMKKAKEKTVIFDENTYFKTRNHILEIKRTNTEKISTRVSNGKIVLKFPYLENIAEEKNQKVIKEAIIRAYRKEAKEYLPKRTKEFSEKYSLKYKNITIKKLKSRWGSCSQCNNINLNLYLMTLPDDLIDYVILHELAHIKHKNHSKKYWEYLEKLCPQSKLFNKNLKNHKADIFN